MTDIATLHTDALALQEVLSEVTTQISRGYGNLAAGKLNRVGQGLTSLVEGLAELDVEEDPPAAAAASATKSTYSSPIPPPAKAKAGKRRFGRSRDD